jgi:hypothetical protein
MIANAQHVPRAENASFKSYANKFGIDTIRFAADKQMLPIDRTSVSITRDENNVFCAEIALELVQKFKESERLILRIGAPKHES